jgi:hypothetical protein
MVLRLYGGSVWEDLDAPGQTERRLAKSNFTFSTYHSVTVPLISNGNLSKAIELPGLCDFANSGVNSCGTKNLLKSPDATF